MHKLSRRTMIAGAAASVAAAPVAAAAVTSPDAELLALVEKAAAKHSEWVATLEAEDLAIHTYSERLPALPAVLLWSPIYADYFEYYMSGGKAWVSPASVFEFRDQVAVRNMHPTVRTRCEQVVAEYERRWALEEQIDRETGRTAFAEREQALNAEWRGIVDAICDMPAETPAGHQAKARLIFHTLWEGHQNVLDGTDGALATSIIAGLVGVKYSGEAAA